MFVTNYITKRPKFHTCSLIFLSAKAPRNPMNDGDGQRPGRGSEGLFWAAACAVIFWALGLKSCSRNEVILFFFLMK